MKDNKPEICSHCQHDTPEWVEASCGILDSSHRVPGMRICCAYSSLMKLVPMN